MGSILTIILLLVGVIVLSLAAISIDRLNFPQRPFQAKGFKEGKVPPRDRTGAHIITEEDEDFDDDR